MIRYGFRKVNVMKRALVNGAYGRDYSGIKSENFTLLGSNTSEKPRLEVLNSLSGEKEVLEALRPDKLLKWYTCGPTVYDEAHLGHARNYLSLDIVQRVLVDYFGYDIVHVMGITDVDDKIIKRSREVCEPTASLIRHFESRFLEDMDSLNIRHPILYARVTNHIEDIFKYIERVIGNGYAYQSVDGSVYFDISKLGKEYWKLGVKDKDDAVEDESNVGKRDPRDFALWKSTGEGQLTKTPHDDYLSWKSPWCPMGRPGWHIECSAMSRRYFGDQIDVHWGGIDLAFPHHNNEIAQDYGYRNAHAGDNTTRWVRYFMHCGHLHIEGHKMSKSLKNFVSIQEFLRENDSEQLRFFCINNRYNSNISFTSERINDVKRQMERFATFFSNVERIQSSAARPFSNVERIQSSTARPVHWTFRELRLFSLYQKLKVDVYSALCDDFDTPKVIKLLLDFMRLGNIYIASTESDACPFLLNNASGYIAKMLSIFGFKFHCVANSSPKADSLDEVVNLLATFRSQIRSLAIAEKSTHQSSQFPKILALCDKIRSDLNDLGIVLSDLSNERFAIRYSKK